MSSLPFYNATGHRIRPTSPLLLVNKSLHAETEAMSHDILRVVLETSSERSFETFGNPFTKKMRKHAAIQDVMKYRHVKIEAGWDHNKPSATAFNSLSSNRMLGLIGVFNDRMRTGHLPAKRIIIKIVGSLYYATESSAEASVVCARLLAALVMDQPLCENATSEYPSNQIAAGPLSRSSPRIQSGYAQSAEESREYCRLCGKDVVWSGVEEETSGGIDC